MLLHHYLEQSALHSPNKQAVSFNQDCVTYRELNDIADSISQRLMALSNGEKCNVGFYLSKSISAVSSIFGVLKSGSAYVPLDVDAPLERSSYIVCDCHINILLTDSTHINKLLEHSESLPKDLKIVLVSGSANDYLNVLPPNWSIVDLSARHKEGTETLPSPNVSADDLAYILYTSGSTGKPKGVMISHSNSMAFVEWCESYFQFTQDDVFSSHAPFHFDLSILDIFACIKVGGKLCLLPPGLAYFGDAMADFIHKNDVTTWYSVPLALCNMLAVGNRLREKISSLKTVIYAGEVFNHIKLNEFLRHLNTGYVYNLYGPTETNVITSFKLTFDDTTQLTQTLPIGKPTPYANTLVVDEDGVVVKPGDVGELVVNGESLMRGYWNAPENTKQKIISLNIGSQCDRFYFTGDLVRELPNGDLVYLNRKDNMIKTRGFRVELGEIEAALLSLSKVNNAVTVATPDDLLGHRITAYIQADFPGAIVDEDIEIHLKDAIPVYMHPEQFIFLESLPHNSRGKVDRIKLQEMAKETS